MKRSIVFSALALIAALILIPLFAHPEGIAGMAAVALVLPLSKASLPEFIMNLSKKEDDAFWGEFYQVSKDAATAIEKLRVDLGYSEMEIAQALGLKDAQEWIAYVKSGKPIEVTAEGITQLAKLFNKMPVAELAAKMVAADPSSATTDPNNPNPAPSVDPNNPNPQKSDDPLGKTQRKSAQVRMVTLSHGADMNATVSDIMKSGTSEQKIAIMKMQLAGLRKGEFEVTKEGIIVQKDDVSIEPGDLNESGTWIPEQSQGILDQMVDRSAFLKEVTNIMSPEKKYHARIINADNIRLSRLGVGWDQGDNRQKPGFGSYNLDHNRIDIEIAILNETIQLHRNKLGNVENIIWNAVMNAVPNRLLWLGFNGTSDSTDEVIAPTNDTTEKSLAKGWFKLASDLSPGAQVIDSGTDAPDVVFQSIIDAQVATNEQYYSDTEQVILTGIGNFKTYVKNLGERTDGLSAVISANTANLKNFGGHSIVTPGYMPSASYMLTSKANLIFSMLSAEGGGFLVGRYPQPGGLVYRVSVWVDYQLINPKAITTATPS